MTNSASIIAHPVHSYWRHCCHQPWIWYQASLLLNANREPGLPFDATLMDNASISALSYSKVPCLIPKITPCWSDSINSPCCYIFCQPFVTVHSDSSLVSVVCTATPVMSLLPFIHLSSRIMQLIILYWLLFLYPLDAEKHTKCLFCLQNEIECVQFLYLVQVKCFAITESLLYIS